MVSVLLESLDNTCYDDRSLLLVLCFVQCWRLVLYDTVLLSSYNNAIRA